MPVPNYHPPTAEQMDAVVDAVARVVGAGGAVMEHCGGGKGRAGTVAACLLLRFGADGVLAHAAREAAGELDAEAGAAMSSDEAIATIRRLRPGSIETTRQVRVVVSAGYKTITSRLCSRRSSFGRMRPCAD